MKMCPESPYTHHLYIMQSAFKFTNTWNFWLVLQFVNKISKPFFLNLHKTNSKSSGNLKKKKLWKQQQMRCQSSDVNDWFFLTNWPRIHVSFFFFTSLPKFIACGCPQNIWLMICIQYLYLTVNKTS